jgi:hypothetical protein
MNEYLFDINLIAAIRIKAESEAEARVTILDHLGCACVNAGAWPNGDPILFEASASGDFHLIEINGEPTCHVLPNSAFVVW